jgi:hypothetical protein
MATGRTVEKMQRHMMSQLKAEREICNLPVTVLVSQKTAKQVLDESGVKPEQLTATSISTVLLKSPSLIENWLRYSASKRISHGWYFLRDQEIYIVGFHPRGEKRVFEYAIEACADFIIKEVSSMQNQR